MNYLFVVLGLIGLLFGAEILLRGAVSLAMRCNISPLVIGLTVVAFATSAPELLVCITAARDGVPSLAIGNIVGSNIANIFLILGVTILITPLILTRGKMLRDGLVFIGAAFVLVIISQTGIIPFWAGIMMLILLAAYLILCCWQERRDKNAHNGEGEIESLDHITNSILIAFVMVVIGAVALIGGSKLLVDNAVIIARSWGVSEAVIGLTLIAIGTSLPEFAAAIVSALRQKVDLVIGNVVGSNIMNILGIAGATALVSPIPVPQSILDFDLWIMLAATIIILIPMLVGGRMKRVFGVLFLIAYGSYITFLYQPVSQVQAILHFENFAIL